jgi:nucleotide-binding universal stress UspA family protein
MCNYNTFVMKPLNILLPTDFSESSYAAFSMAQEMLLKGGGKLNLLHVVVTPLDWEKVPKDREYLYPEVKAEIGEARARITEWEREAIAKGIETKSLLLFNRSYDALLHEATKGYDLMVMGSHGARGIKEATMGSIAQKVIRESPIPVLVFKQLPEKLRFNKLLLASHCHSHYDEAYQKIIDIAAFFDAEIHVLYVNTPAHFTETPEAEDHMLAFSNHYRLHKAKIHIFNATTVERGIDRFSKIHEVDLVALVTSGKSGITQFFNPSIAESIVNHAQMPVLTVRK